jgi:hypothetical protein
MLILLLVDKEPGRYVIKYGDFEDKTFIGTICFPEMFIERIESLQEGQKFQYDMSMSKENSEAEIVSVGVEKIISTRKIQYKFTVDYGSFYVDAYEFNNKLKIKSYLFNTYVDIKVYNEFGIIVTNCCRFLKVYDTRFKAAYGISKFYKKFSKMYQKYIIEDAPAYDAVGGSSLIHENIIFEKKIYFRARSGFGSALYTFTIITQEKG